MPFFSKIMNCERFLHILQYLHFPNTGGAFDSIGKLWKTMESMTHFNNEWCILIPNIWLVAKYWYFSKESLFSVSMSHWNTGILEYRYTNYVICLATHVNLYCGKDRICATENVSTTHRNVRHLAKK